MPHIIIGGRALCGTPSIEPERSPNGSPVPRPPCGDCISIAQGAHVTGRSVENERGAPAPAPVSPPPPAAAVGVSTTSNGHVLVDGAALCGSMEIEPERTPNGSPIPRAACGDCASIADSARHHGTAPRRASVAVHTYISPAARERAVRLASTRVREQVIGPATAGAWSTTGAQPKVSFITCSYNRPDLLRAAVESLLAQTDPSWEQLICDDASTDPRVEETLRWAERVDPRIRVWRRRTNLDAPAVLWNFLLDRAHGRYFSVLDDDNTKLPRFIEVLAGILDAEPLDFVTCGFVVTEASGRTEEYPINLSTNPTTTGQQSTCDGGAILYRRETFARVGYFSEALRTGEDWDWLRRAVHFCRYRNLRECLSTYRVHHEQRMTRSHALGTGYDIEWIKARPVGEGLGVRVVRPPTSRLTRSQEDAISSADRALAGGVRWAHPGGDLAVVLSPFQLSDEDIRHGVGDCPRILSVHIEDPYALQANLERVRAMVALGREVWVSTNDASTVDHYRSVVDNRVIVCPLLGVDTARALSATDGRDIDVLLCGYAYPSRKRFMSELLPLLAGKTVVLVGDGWEGSSASIGAATQPTQGLEATYTLHARAKTVVCFHREGGDCSDGPVAPASLNRGFMEGYFGARVFVDRKRTEHSVDPDDVIFYDGPRDLAASINRYLETPRVSAYAEKCRLLYTYRARVERMLNCVRAPRYLAVIP